VAILGVCRSSTEPRWDGQAFVPRLILPLSLSWDHRVIDGAAAARFNAYLARSWRTSVACCYEANDKVFSMAAIRGCGMGHDWRTSRCCARRWVRCRQTSCACTARDAVFDTFLKLHPKLKEQYFLNTKEEDADPYESSQFTVLIANAQRHLRRLLVPRGVRVRSLLGHRLGPQLCTGRDARRVGQGSQARELAETGVRAGCEFDKNSAGPVQGRPTNSR
jgi:ATP-dependent HslUV protease subunit HslV